MKLEDILATRPTVDKLLAEKDLPGPLKLSVVRFAQALAKEEQAFAVVRDPLVKKYGTPKEGSLHEYSFDVYEKRIEYLKALKPLLDVEVSWPEDQKLDQTALAEQTCVTAADLLTLVPFFK